MARTTSPRIVALFTAVAALGHAGCADEEPTAPAGAHTAPSVDIVPAGSCLTVANELVGDFRVCRLATLGGTAGQAKDVNDDGWIVGRTQRADGVSVGTLWKPGEDPTDLGLAAGMSDAAAISSNGWVAGSAYADGGWMVIRWREDTGAEELGRPSGISSLWSTGINYNGYVSASGRSGTIFQATRYTTFWAGRIGDSGADDINDAGTMVGWSRIDGDRRAVAWGDDLWRVDLGTLPGDRQGSALGISDAFPAHIVGYSEDVYLNKRAFIRDPVERELFELPGFAPYGSEAFDVNDAGYAVGRSELADGSTIHAVLWTPDRQVVDLVGLGGAAEYSEAVAINNYGVIVGYSWVSGTGYPTAWHVATTPPPPSPDGDRDGIDDVVDTDPDVESDGFSDISQGGGTTGTIVDRGGQKVTVKEVAEAGVRIAVQASSQFGFVRLSVCDGAGTIFLRPGYRIVVTCSSVTVRVESGYVSINFEADDGTIVSASVGQPNAVTFHPEDGSLEAAADNTGVVTVWGDEEDIYLGPGERLEGTGPSNAAPIADAGSDQTVECQRERAAEVNLDGSGSSDPDDDELTYSWSENGTVIASGPTPTVALALGDHAITLTVDDGNGGTASDELIVTVEDTQAPTLAMTVVATELWPPNHEMRLVVEGISASDACCDPTLDIAVESDEPVNGDGDGDSEPDWQVVEDGQGGHDVWVRAERSGGGDGRLYTITVTAEDCSGNRAEDAVEVTVPKSRKGKGRN